MKWWSKSVTVVGEGFNPSLFERAGINPAPTFDLAVEGDFLNKSNGG
jgi:hypothetical protein